MILAHQTTKITGKRCDHPWQSTCLSSFIIFSKVWKLNIKINHKNRLQIVMILICYMMILQLISETLYLNVFIPITHVGISLSLTLRSISLVQASSNHVLSAGTVVFLLCSVHQLHYECIKNCDYFR